MMLRSLSEPYFVDFAWGNIMKNTSVLPGILVLCLVGMLALFNEARAAIWQVDAAGGGDFTTIQAAVDNALAGDLILVAPGHYAEQVVVAKDNLTINGSGDDVTFIDSPAQLTDYFIIGSYYFPVVLVRNCGGVVFSNLTLDGMSQGDANLLFQGFGFFNAGGALDTVHITGIHGATLLTVPHGNGVFAVTVDGTARSLDLTNVRIDDFQKSGVVLDGPDLTGTLSNVSVTGLGATSTLAQNGFQVSRGAVFTLADCSVSSLDFTGSTWAATGFLGTAGTSVAMNGCTADGIQTSVYMEDNTASFTDGSVTNPVGDALIASCTGAKTLVDRRRPQPVEIPTDKSGFTKSTVTMDINGSVFTGSDTLDSWGPAAISAGLVNFNLTDCTISHFERGFVIVEDGGTVGGMARGCSFIDNLSLAGWSNSVIDYDARQNWWGHISGPYHPVKNPGGLGAVVTDHILFDPWTMIGPGIIATVPDHGPVRCGVPMPVTVTYLADPAATPVRGYSVTFRITGPATVSTADIFDAGAMGHIGAHLFQALDNGDGTFTVDDALLGATPGLTATADLFTMNVQTTGDGTVGVEFVDYCLRDPDNHDLYAPLLGTSFIVDCIAPAPVTDISAAPGHNKITVTWNHDDLDVDHYEIFRGLWYDTTIGVSAYPEYDDLPGAVIPVRPATWAEADADPQWEWAGSIPAGVHAFTDTWSDASHRGVYYYEVFAVDAVLNGDAATTNDRATNYWLGDVTGIAAVTTPNGLVDSFDMSDLGTAFGTTEAGGPPYNNLVDVGPTDDWSRLGIPTTDNAVDFEDLMIFSLNFGVVTPAKVLVTEQESVDLAWVRRDEGHMALVMTGGRGLKGLRVQAAVPVSGVAAGSLLKQQDGEFFLRNVGNHLDANLALLGAGRAFTGTGELFVVETAGNLSVADLKITARGIVNQDLQADLEKPGNSERPALPTDYSLGTGYPNPFNPITTISFSLPTTQHVKLVVYGVDGRRIATLVDETRGPGRYEATWTGRDDRGRAMATGTYFFRMDAGPYSKVRKMTLVK